MNTQDSWLVQVMAQVLIAVLVPVLTAAVIGLVGTCIRFVRGKMTAQQLALADSLVKSFALAAEQYDLGGVVKRSGQQKKDWVVAMAQSALEKRGISLDVRLLADLTEAAVLSEVKKARWNEPDMLLISPGELNGSEALASKGGKLPGTGKKPGPVKAE